MEKYLKVEQVADLLQISKRTIYDWIHVGYIPHYKFPRGVRFNRAHLDHWLQNKQRKGRNQYCKGIEFNESG